MVKDDGRAKRRLVIFDLCETLYAANTTVGFLNHYQQTGGHPKVALALRRWTGRNSIFFYLGALAYRLLSWDIARSRLVAALAGERRQPLESAASNYAHHALPPLFNAPIHDRLSRHKDAGDRVVIVSNSLDLVVAPIAEALGVEFASSVVGFHDNICTGRIVQDLTGRKADALRQLIGASGGISHVYTDNRSDLDIVTIAEQATIVVPRGRRDEHWGGSHCEYIRL